MKKMRVSFGFVVIIMCVSLLFAVGCSKTATVKDGGAEQQMAAQKESAASAGQAEGKAAGKETAASRKAAAKAKAAAAMAGKLKDSYTVKKGDCLWGIAKKKTVYNDPFQWPILYEANKDIIKKANLIYPGQKFKVPRSGLTMDDVKKARKEAGAKKPYSPPANAIVPI